MTASRSAVPRPDAHVHFGVFFQGVNHTTIWSDSSSGSQIDFETFRRLVLTAERGLFDAFFLGEGLRLREQNGKILDLDIAGRPDAIAQLAALAGITDKIGWSRHRTPRTTNRPTSPVDSPASIYFPTDGPAGTRSPPTTLGRERISVAVVSSTTPCVTSVPGSSSKLHGHCGIRGPTTRSRTLARPRTGRLREP